MLDEKHASALDQGRKLLVRLDHSMLQYVSMCLGFFYFLVLLAVHAEVVAISARLGGSFAYLGRYQFVLACCEVNRYAAHSL